MDVAYAFVPNRKVGRMARRLFAALWAGIIVAYWVKLSSPILPRPWEVGTAWIELAQSGVLPQALIASLKLNATALAASTVISLLVCYASVLPIFRPIAGSLSLMRYMGLTGLTFLFMRMFSGFELRVALLTFGMSVFFVKGMMDVIKAITTERYQYVRSLGMSEWRVAWEIVILGTLHLAFAQVIMNGAIGWLMLTTVEGLSRSGGGLGVLLSNTDKTFRLADVFALQATVLIVGAAIDKFLWDIYDLIPYIKRDHEEE